MIDDGSIAQTFSTVSTSTSETTSSTTDDQTPTSTSVIYIAAGSAAGGVVALTVVATMFICIVLRVRKRRRDKYTVGDGIRKEKSPSSDGYTNALYNGEQLQLPKDVMYGTNAHVQITYIDSMQLLIQFRQVFKGDVYFSYLS